MKVVHVRVLRKGQELLSANSGSFQINQLVFADDTALVATSPMQQPPVNNPTHVAATCQQPHP